MDENGGRHVAYTYDALNRLTSETITDPTAGNRTIQYTYDAVGNRLSKDDSVQEVTTYTYDANDRLLNTTNNGQVTQYTYDNNGNTLSSYTSATDTTTYHWDDQNRLVGADVTDSTGNHHIQERYNADGIRVASIVDGQETRYLIDANRPYAEVLEEYSPDGTVQASYVYGQELISQNRREVESFYVKDGLGSIRALTNAGGSVTDTYTYEAFGNLIGSTGNTVNNYRYTAEQYDPSLGDYYLRHRYYAPETGSFTRRDTYAGSISEPLTLQKYTYANDNPVNGVDPSGLFTISDTLATLNIFEQLAASVYATALSPEAIEIATAWAVIIGVSAVSLFVVEETAKNGETSLRVVPDEAPQPTRPRREPMAPPEPQEMNQMRLQLQDAPGDTFGIPIQNVPEVGVTVRQVGEAVWALWSYRRTLASWFPEEHDTALIKGMAKVGHNLRNL